MKDRKENWDRRCGRFLVCSMLLPYSIAAITNRRILPKVIGFYAIIVCIDPMYDAGHYLSFFINAPRNFRHLIDLDKKDNFAPLQTRLFMRFCADKELKLASN